MSTILAKVSGLIPSRVPWWYVVVALLLLPVAIYVVAVQGRSVRIGPIEFGSYQNPSVRNCSSLIENTNGMMQQLQSRSHDLNETFREQTEALTRIMSQRDEYRRHPDPASLMDVFHETTPFDESLNRLATMRDTVERELVQGNQTAIDLLMQLRRVCAGQFPR